MFRQYSSALTDFHPFRDVESQLRDQTQDFVTSLNTGNYDLAARLFANDGVLMAAQDEGAYGQKQVERLLRELCEAGLIERYGEERAANYASLRERLDYELNIINTMGFAAYFLIVWDFIKYARDNEIPVGPGRGSAVGSVV